MDLNKIYNEDCLSGMRRIPDASIDAIICDLPYGTTRNKWDSIIPLDELWVQYERIIKDNGAIVLFSQQPFTSILVSSNLKMFKYEWIWQKEKGTGFLNSKYAPMKAHENICVFSKSAASYVKDKSKAMLYNPQYLQGKGYTMKAWSTSNNYDSRWYKPIETNNDGDHYYPIDVINFNSDNEKIHPTQKPVNLVRYLIQTYSNEGDTICDNCIGSGTTAIACIREKRNFIGFETNKEYFDIANKRISNEKSNLTLL